MLTGRGAAGYLEIIRVKPRTSSSKMPQAA